MNDQTRTGTGWRLALAGLLLFLVPVAGAFLAASDQAVANVDSAVLVGFGIAILLRAVWFVAFGRRLHPLIDMPLLGVAFVVTGGSSSPLDPALFFVYVLIAFYREPSPRELRTYSTFLVGILAMYGILLTSVWDSGQEALSAQQAELNSVATEVRAPFVAPAFSRDDVIELCISLEEKLEQRAAEIGGGASAAYFTPNALSKSPFASDFSLYAEQLEGRAALLRGAVPELRGDLTPDEAMDLRQHLVDGFASTGSNIEKAEERLDQAFDSLSADRSGSAVTEMRFLLDHGLMETMQATQTNQERIEVGIQEFIDGVTALDDEGEAFDARFIRLVTERIAMAILVLATLSLLLGLRARFEKEVRRRESERAEGEMAVKEAEKENWIALTAGLTHTIGNDILAYDAYAEEALEILREQPGDLPAEVEQAVRFIYESNKARMGFIKFLDEFARMRKQTSDGERIKPKGLSSLPIEPLLMDVRRRVGEVEVADMPRDARDPLVTAQRKRFLELPLEVVFEGEPHLSFARGKKGVLQFFFYELIKNALRNCSGKVPLRVAVSSKEGRVLLSFQNDLEIAECEGEEKLYRLPRIADMEPCSDEDLKKRVSQILDYCFDPGKGGGTGLGLFLIRYFAKEYYSGSVNARIVDWSRRVVAFELELPDDLDALFEEDAGE